MDTNRVPRISIVPRPNRIRVTLNENHLGKTSKELSPEPFAKLTQAMSFQSTLLKAEEMPHDKKQTKILSNSSSITDNSVTPKMESTKANATKSKPLIIAIIVVSVIALGALAFGLYSFIQMSKTTTSTTSAVSGLKWCTAGTTVAGTGNSGSQVTQVQSPWHTAFDSSGTLYVSDSTGQLNGVSGPGSSFLNRPYGVCVDSNNNIYVADTSNHRVQFWSSDGSTVYTIAGTGSNGPALNQLSSPYSISLDPNSNKFYIADTGNHRILRFVFNVTTGVLVAGGQGSGTASNQLSFPTHVYFDSVSNSLFIANMNAHSVVRWVLDANIWILVAGLPGSNGYTPLLLNNPQGLTLDSAGNVYVADTNNHRIQFSRPGNATGTTIAGLANTIGTSSSLFDYPRSVLLDNQLNLYISDTNNDRVQMFPRC